MKPQVGDRVIIREHVAADLPDYADWQCDPAVGEYVSFLPRTREEAEASLRDAIEQQTEPDRVRFFVAIEHKDNGGILGGAGITLIDEHTGDIGWFLRKEYWGLGYATEAAALMIRFGFEDIGLRTITAVCRKENSGSRRMMQKCGFRFERATENRLEYTLTYTDWKNNAADRHSGS
jgi:ribosomal-protein-alanine N-acetyltransferase